MGNSRLSIYQFDGLGFASSLDPLAAAQSVSSGEVPEIRSNCLFFLEIISTSASADDVCSTARWAAVVFRSISLMGLTSSPPSTPSLPLSPFHQVRYLKFDLTTCFFSKSSVHQYLLTMFVVQPDGQRSSFDLSASSRAIRGVLAPSLGAGGCRFGSSSLSMPLSQNAKPSFGLGVLACKRVARCAHLRLGSV